MPGTPKHAILLLAHGTPDRLSDMAEYLRHVTGGRPMPEHVVEELQHRYAEIGLRDDPVFARRRLDDRPPLTRWTLLQGKLLSEAIGEPVYVGMRNWHPFIADVVRQMRRDGITYATVLCLAPQNSRTSTGLYRRALEAALDTVYADAPESSGLSQARFTYSFIAGWADEPRLVQAFAERLWPAWAEACARASQLAGKPVRVPVLFTAHSVPCRTIRATSAEEAARGSAPRPGAPVPAEGIQNYGATLAGDPYPIECKQTAAAIARRLAPLGLTEADWIFAFQSQGIAGAPWIGPTVESTFEALAKAGHKSVVMQPVGFLCDHVEILYDIDLNFGDFGATLGLKVTRAESLNDSPTLIQALQQVLERTPADGGAAAWPSSSAEVLTAPLPEMVEV